MWRSHTPSAPQISRGVPALTLSVAPGVGFAEDPGGVASFGMDRCGLIADGVERALDLGATSLEDRLALVAEAFRRSGADLDRPFLRSPVPASVAVAR